MTPTRSIHPSLLTQSHLLLVLVPDQFYNITLFVSILTSQGNSPSSRDQLGTVGPLQFRSSSLNQLDLVNNLKRERWSGCHNWYPLHTGNSCPSPIQANLFLDIKILICQIDKFFSSIIIRTESRFKRGDPTNSIVLV